MPITTGQLIFAGIFFVIFVFVIVVTYRKDKALHKKYYKNNFWVLIIFILFVLLLVAVKVYFGDRQ